MHAGREANDQQSRIGVAKRWDRAAKVARLVQAQGIEEGGQARAAPARRVKCAVHPISPRQTLAFRPVRDSDTRSLACLPPPAFLDVCQGVLAWFFGILYGCPVLDS